jgi:hypothetical protein
MRAALIGLAALATALALALGWVTGRPPSQPLTVTRVSTERPLQMLPNPNEGPQASLDAFAQALGPSPAPPKPVGEGAPPPRPAPPPEPDVASIFRRQLAAVVEQGPDGRLAVLLTGEGPSRMLRPGEDFMAGWKLRSVEMNQVVLARGRERKAIALFDARGGPPVPPQTGAPTTPLASSPHPDASGEPMAQNDRALTREASA